jgi:hypothetical protein
MNGSEIIPLPGGSVIGMLLRHSIARVTRRGQARRQLKQLQRDIDECAFQFVDCTKGGTIPQFRLPTDSAAHLATLYADGFLTTVEAEVLRDYFAAAEQANHWLSAPEQAGPEGENATRRLMSLLRGRAFVERQDGSGQTFQDLTRAAVARALSAIEQRRWRPW